MRAVMPVERDRISYGDACGNFRCRSTIISAALAPRCSVMRLTISSGPIESSAGSPP
jgi:hypothetical protein